MVEAITSSTYDIFQSAQKQFLPTPKKCHYIFNLRDMSRVFQGLLEANITYFNDSTALTKLWVHESFRVFSDRLVDEADHKTFFNLINNQLTANMSSTWSTLFRDPVEPTPHCAFIQEGPNIPLKELADLNELRKILMDRLQEYNETRNHVPMNLVLFNEAVLHTCRIMRIVGRPFGHALLIGLGGSGRQSLCRLAAHILEMEFFSLSIARTYGDREFREDIKKTDGSDSN